MRRLVAIAACVAAVLPAATDAAVCALDPRPAATLLLPYFEHDYATGCGFDGREHSTVVSLHNASDSGQLARVMLWSRGGVPVLDFYLYLHGRQSRRIALDEVLCDGVLPRSGPQWQRNTRFGPSPHYPLCGSGSGFDPNVAPGYSVPLDADRRAAIRRALTGKPDPGTGACHAPDAGDDVARGYITVDDAVTCSALAPDSAGFVQSDLGHDNVWLGSWQLTGLSGNVGGGSALVAIESAPPGFFANGATTFYGRYNDYSALDQREPLPSTWATGFLQGGSPQRTADWIAWRDTPRTAPSTALCAPGGEQPLGARDQRGFDAGGQSQGAPQGAPLPIGLATQRIPAAALESTSTVM